MAPPLAASPPSASGRSRRPPPSSPASGAAPMPPQGPRTPRPPQRLRAPTGCRVSYLRAPPLPSAAVRKSAANVARLSAVSAAAAPPAGCQAGGCKTGRGLSSTTPARARPSPSNSAGSGSSAASGLAAVAVRLPARPGLPARSAAFCCVLRAGEPSAPPAPRRGARRRVARGHHRNF